MTVPKTTGLTPHEPPIAKTEDVSPQGGEFEAVLEEKEGKSLPGKKGGRRPAPAGGAQTIRPTDPTTGRGRLVSEGRGRAPGGAAGTGRPETGSPETGSPGTGFPEAEAREAAAEHALKDWDADPTTRTARRGADTPGGELATPVPTHGSPVALATVDAPAGAEPAARIERIAEQILLAAEVRLHRDGAVEARLQLDLGRLGRMHVALERTAEGQIRVALEPTSAEARDLLQAHGKQLATRLEARGLKLQALTVESSGETVLRIEGTGKETNETTNARAAGPASDSVPADPAAGQEAPRGEPFDQEHERRDRRERHEPEPEEEE
jgi:hypothetical protein